MFDPLPSLHRWLHGGIDLRELAAQQQLFILSVSNLFS